MVKKREKILLAMSGGVDSSVCAKILKERGFEVIGVHFLFSKNKFSALKKTQEIASKLGIEFIWKDYADEFDKKVVKYFLNEYSKGNTPNPCVFCNKEFKFKKLIDLADEMKIAKIATGHYAQIERINNGELFAIKKAIYQDKDQSYFLAGLTSNQIAKVIFPLGALSKSTVKKIAQESGLLFEEGESQDVCFFSKKERLADFLKEKICFKKGEIVDEKGVVLGFHDGLFNFTIGQRKGINLGGVGPFYVFAKDFKKNHLLVTKDFKNPLLQKKVIDLNCVNWIKIPDFKKKYQIKIRYSKESAEGSIIFDDKLGWKAYFDLPQWAVAPGQVLAVYEEDVLLGGGIMI